MILFVQPFSISSASGGGRILRTLLRQAPVDWLSVAATPQPITTANFGKEIHLRGRPYLGRLERSRFAHLPRYLELWAARRLHRKLRKLCVASQVRGVHGLAHYCWDTLAAYRAAQEGGLPFFLSVHDDPAYCLGNHPYRETLLEQTGEVWRSARACYVISQEMGEEMARRWGKRDFILVTDGLEKVAPAIRPPSEDPLIIYFMGMFHRGYTENLLALQEGLSLFQRKHPETKAILRFRCASLPKETLRPEYPVEVLPFADEKVVEQEVATAGILYLPLSMSEAGRPMAAYSLSTKMVSYLGAGLPILFHGPADSAAGQLLARFDAAEVCSSEDPAAVAQALERVLARRETLVQNALRLGASQFSLQAIAQRFWQPVLSALARA